MKSMSEERSQHLIGAAEKVAELMNVGVHPDAALRKVAIDESLNAEEIKRVSEATNNAKTISVLANSKPSDKASPFPITNADKVNEELWSTNPDAESHGTSDESGNFDAQKLKSKKAAAAQSLASTGSYLDTEPVDHASTVREACGHHIDNQHHQKYAVEITDAAELVLHVENSQSGTIKIASADGRIVGNPYRALDEARHLAEDARTKVAEDSDAAHLAIESISESFRRTDAPAFARVEKLAQHYGVPAQILDIVYEYSDLGNFGHARADDSMKLADEWSIARCTPAEKSHAERMVHATAMAKAASDALYVYNQLTAGIEKLSADISTAVKHISTEAEGLPGKLMGSGFDHSKAVDLIGNATDTTNAAGDKPDVEHGDESPLDVNTRQELANNSTAMDVQKLMGDNFIGSHPLSQVVDAFNRIKSVNPNLSSAEVNSLVKHDLSTEGAVPFDTLHRARPSSK